MASAAVTDVAGPTDVVTVATGAGHLLLLVLLLPRLCLGGPSCSWCAFVDVIVVVTVLLDWLSL